MTSTAQSLTTVITASETVGRIDGGRAQHAATRLQEILAGTPATELPDLTVALAGLAPLPQTLDRPLPVAEAQNCSDSVPTRCGTTNASAW